MENRPILSFSPFFPFAWCCFTLLLSSPFGRCCFTLLLSSPFGCCRLPLLLPSGGSLPPLSFGLVLLSPSLLGGAFPLPKENSHQVTDTFFNSMIQSRKHNGTTQKEEENAAQPKRRVERKRHQQEKREKAAQSPKKERAKQQNPTKEGRRQHHRNGCCLPHPFALVDFLGIVQCRGFRGARSFPFGVPTVCSKLTFLWE